MKKSFLSLLLILGVVFSTLLTSNFAFARGDISVNPGQEPNEVRNQNLGLEANISHCQQGFNYCKGCCEHEVQVAREKATAALQSANSERPAPKSQSGGQ